MNNIKYDKTSSKNNNDAICFKTKLAYPASFMTPVMYNDYTHIIFMEKSYRIVG